MKCPKCGFTSFDSLDSCRKCGKNLTEAKNRLGFFGTAPPPESAEAYEAPADLEPSPEPEQSLSFGFDDTKDDDPFEFETQDEVAEEELPLDCAEEDPFAFDTDEEELPLDCAEEDPFAFETVEEELFFETAEEDFLAAPAGIGGIEAPALLPRALASAVDLSILALVFFLFLSAGEMVDGGKILPSPETLADRAVPYFLVLFAICFGYFTLFHFLSGQPPGKMLFGLRVECEQSGPLSFSQAFLRSVGGLLSTLPAGLGYLGVACDDQRRGWSDRLAGTRVVRDLAKEEDAAELWQEG